MLTGPVTILNWSFVRDDQPREETCRQIALAIRDEVADLDAAGIAVIQIDEPALREGLPLRHADQADYLRWAVECFRLAAAGARPETQVQTHMCYSEFGEIFAEIDALDADVLLIEHARSDQELLEVFRTEGYDKGIGPGVYDVHSPRVPDTAELTRPAPGHPHRAAARPRLGQPRLRPENPQAGRGLAGPGAHGGGGARSAGLHRPGRVTALAHGACGPETKPSGPTTIDKFCCQWCNGVMDDVGVIDDPAAAIVALEPIRSRLLAELAEPASAATLATRVGIARQKVNYHVRALEAHQLVRQAGKRQWGGLTERLLVASASSYIVSPRALGPVAVDPDRGADRLSASYLIALAARIVDEVSDLLRRSRAADKRLATLSLDTEIRFRSAADRAAFSNELIQAVTDLVARYHDESAPGGRAHRLMVMAHPLPHESQRVLATEESSCQ